VAIEPSTAADRLDIYARACGLTPRESSEREQRESGHPVRDRYRPRGPTGQRQLAAHPQREQYLDHGQAQHDGRQQ